MTFVLWLAAVLIAWLINAVLLWLAVNISHNKGDFAGIFFIAALTSVLSTIPAIGWLLAAAVYFIMLTKLTTAKFWPDAVVITIVNMILCVAVRYGLSALSAILFD